MRSEQIKTLLVNIMTGAVVIAVVVVGYVVFVNNDSATVSDTSVASLDTGAQTTVIVGIDVAKTVRILEDLERSVKGSVAVFGMSTFKNLKDFSVTIPKEAVGRENPFVATEWKLKLKMIEDMAAKQSRESGVPESLAPAPPIVPQTKIEIKTEESSLSDTTLGESQGL